MWETLVANSSATGTAADLIANLYPGKAVHEIAFQTKQTAVITASLARKGVTTALSARGVSAQLAPLSTSWSAKPSSVTIVEEL